MHLKIDIGCVLSTVLFLRGNLFRLGYMKGLLRAILYTIYVSQIYNKSQFDRILLTLWIVEDLDVD